MTAALTRWTTMLMVLVAPLAAPAAERYPACRLPALTPLPATPLGAVGVADIEREACVEHPLEWDKATAGERMEHFRVAAGEPAKEKRVWGVALAGGGSKAAPAAVGVLAGLHDIGLLPHVDYISTVSGGGYGAYFFYTRFLNDAQAGGVVSWKRLNGAVRDCYRATGQLRAAGVEDDEICTMLDINSAPSKWTCGSKAFNFVGSGRRQLVNTEQAWLRCSQDVLEPADCNFSGTDTDVWKARANAVTLTTLSVLTAPLHHAMNTVFDWGVSLSPSRHAYFRGIGTSYGTTQHKPDVLVEDAIERLPESTYRAPHHTFADLQKITNGAQLPTWIINATAVPHRSLFGWLGSPERDFERDSFEFTPFSFGSARLGFINRPREDMSVLDAVVTSAAFFDANQIATKDGRPLLALAQHTFNANWGIDVPNWNTSGLRRGLHRAMPFPLYYLDGFVASTIAANTADDPTMRQDRIDRVSSTFVRLVDGGSADNTGAYALVRRGVKNIIIVDAAQDKGSQFEDLALLCKQVYAHHDLYLVFPGVEGLDRFPGDAASASAGTKIPPRCDELPEALTYQQWMHPTTTDDDRKRGVGIIYRWPGPIIYGCLTKSPVDQCKTNVESRIYLLKPAVDALTLHRRAECPGKNSDAVAKACVRRLMGVSRYGTEPSDWSTQPLPCEPTLYALDNYTDETFSSFPQDGTVATTMNSSHSRFSAYRDLMRFYAQFLPGNAQLNAEKNYPNDRFASRIAMQERQNARPRFDMPRVNDHVCPVQQ